MIVAAAVVLTIVLLWSLVAHRLEKWHLSLPLVLVIAGLSVGWESSEVIFDNLDNSAVEKTVEIILALLLFLDAAELGRFKRRDIGATIRLLVIAIPFSILLATLFTRWLYPGMSLILCFVVACIVVPTDMTPAATIVKGRRIPDRVRGLLNIESGYNDGLVAPFFTFGLILLAGGIDSIDVGGEALDEMIPALLWAALVGVTLGASTAYASKFAQKHQLTTPQFQAIGTLAIPLLAYFLTLYLGGNGFVAAFITGLVHRAIYGPKHHEMLKFAEDISVFAQAIVWFVFGQLLAYTFVVGIEWKALLMALASLTVVRMVPVFFSLLGSSVQWRDRILISWLGPRGIASIVFALLAFQEVTDDEREFILQVLSFTILFSILLHGFSAPLIAKRLEGCGQEHQELSHENESVPSAHTS